MKMNLQPRANMRLRLRPVYVMIKTPHKKAGIQMPMPTSATRTILYLDHTAKISGGEVALLNLIKALDRTRYTPVVVLASGGALVEKLKQDGVETHVIPLPLSVINTRKDVLGLNSLTRLRQAWLCIRYAVKLAVWARMRKVDLIHTNSLKADLYGGLAARLAQIPVLWHVRDRITDGYLPAPVAVAFRWMARTIPQAVVTNSESTLRCLDAPRAPAADGQDGVSERASFSRQMHVVHDGFDPEQFKNSLAASSSFPERPVVALVGRISPWKGQHIFLEAAAQVRRNFPLARFWIVGAALFEEHEYERGLHEIVARHGLEDTVEFLGFQEDVPRILELSDLVVHASTLGEPFGQVVIEGMAAGRPVIATDGGALPEIIQSGQTGLLVPMGDAGAMAQALEALLSDPARSRAMGIAGQLHARQHFTNRHVARSIEKIYEKVLARAGSFPTRGLPAARRATRRDSRPDELSLAAEASGQ